MDNTGKIKKRLISELGFGYEQIDSLHKQLDYANRLIDTIKQVLQSEVETAKDNPTPDDVDSREFGILDGRLEFAEELLAIIWSELIKKGVTNGTR